MTESVNEKKVDIFSHNRSLEIMALFESDFSFDWIQEISGLKGTEILQVTEDLFEQGYLEKKGVGQYAFKNENIRQELNATVSTNDNESWHRQITQIIFRDIPDEDKALLAASTHLLQMQNDDSECRNLLKAGNIFRRKFQYKAAQRCYRKLIEDLQNRESETADKLYINTVISYSKIIEVTVDLEFIINPIKKAIRRSKKNKNKKQTALLEMNFAKIEWYRSNFQSALGHFNRGWSLAEGIDDEKLRRSALVFNTFFLYHEGKYNEVIQIYESVVSDIDKYPKGRFPLLSAQIVGICYAFNGQVELGMGLMDAIYSQCQKSGDTYVSSYVAFHIGILLIELQRYDEAISYLKVALDKAKHSSNKYTLFFSCYYLACAYYWKNQKDDSIKYFNLSMELISRKSINQLSSLYCYPELFWAMETGKYPKIGTLSFAEEIAKAKSSRILSIKGIAFRYQALSDERVGHLSYRIISALLESERLLTESGHEFQLARTRLELARTYLLLGEENNAREIVQKSSDIFNTFLLDKVPDNLRFLLRDLRSNEYLMEEMMKMSQELVTIQNHQQLIRYILVKVTRITGAERGALFMLDDENGSREIELRAARNITEEDILHPDFYPSIEMIRKSIRKGKADFRLTKITEKTNPLKHSTVHSCIAVPFVLREKVLGVLYVDNRIFASALKKSDIRILEYFSAQAAMALDNVRLHKENSYFKKRLKDQKLQFGRPQDNQKQSVEFIGNSNIIQQVLTDVKKVAVTDSTVLILGETGVGKELIANAIQYESTRHKEAFIQVNCSTFPEALVASELFGHEKGAFTGALKTHIGRFELADGGTLFLDEIGDIPMEVQVRLLRVLQNKEFERVGGSETLHSDFRLLAATNRDLRKDIALGRFREDLYYRLNVMSLHIPPLRERRDDIPLLVDYFLKQFQKKTGKQVKSISEEDMERLVTYGWPGNVRELENTIERATILSTDKSLSIPELNHSSLNPSPHNESVSLQENERQYIIQTLKRTKGKIYGSGGAAELLDINPNTLVSRMRKRGIQKTSWIKFNP